jgi:hypothetical protein
MPQPLHASFDGASVQGCSRNGTSWDEPGDEDPNRALTRSAITSTNRSMSLTGIPLATGSGEHLASLRSARRIIGHGPQRISLATAAFKRAKFQALSL